MNSIASDFFHDFHPSCPGEDHPRFTVYVTGLIAYQHPRIFAFSSGYHRALGRHGTRIFNRLPQKRRGHRT